MAFMSPYQSEFKLILRGEKIAIFWSISIQKSLFVFKNHYHRISASWYHMSISSIDIIGRCPSGITLNIHSYIIYSYLGSISIQITSGSVGCQYISKFPLLLWINFIVMPDTNFKLLRLWVITRPNSVIYHRELVHIPIPIMVVGCSWPSKWSWQNFGIC